MNRFSSSLLTAIACVATLDAADLYVAPAGNDSYPGTKEQPFATPARALEAVRTLVARRLEADVRVIFDAGTYELSAPLTFTAADAGTAEHSVMYAAAPGKTVVISGGRRITNWKREGQNWTARLADVQAGKWFFRQLVVNNRRAVRARWPNEDGTLHIATVGDGVKSFTFDSPLPKENLGGQDAEFVVYENWSVSRALITGSADGRLTTATSVGWIGHGDMTTASPGKPAFLEHARVGLDQPGEWFLDRKAGVLTYLATDTDEPSAIIAVAPVLTQLVKIVGTKEKPVRNLRFQGLRFEHADFPLPPIGYSEIQAAHYGPNMNEPTHVQPVAIECAFAEGCRFEGCRFAHLNPSFTTSTAVPTPMAARPTMVSSSTKAAKASSSRPMWSMPLPGAPFGSTSASTTGTHGRTTISTKRPPPRSSPKPRRKPGCNPRAHGHDSARDHSAEDSAKSETMAFFALERSALFYDSLRMNEANLLLTRPLRAPWQLQA